MHVMVIRFLGFAFVLLGGGLGSAFAGQIPVKPSANTSVVLPVTYYVCNSGKAPKVGSRYAKIQSAVDAAVAAGNLTSIISICEGTYREDIVVKTKRTIRFQRQDRGNVYIAGKGDANSAFRVEEACEKGQTNCFGTVTLDGISFRKAGQGEKPEIAMDFNTIVWCSSDGCKVDRLKGSFLNGSIDGFSTGLQIIGVVDFTVENVAITNTGRATGEYPPAAGAIFIQQDYEQPVGVGSGGSSTTTCPYEIGAKVAIKNSKISYNKGSNTGVYYASAVYASGAVVTVERTQFYRNQGQSLFVGDCATVSMTQAEFFDNTSDKNYMISVSGDGLTFDSGTIRDNTLNGDGAILGLGTATITGSSIRNNKVSGTGGAASVSRGTLKSTGSSWSNNSPADVYHTSLQKTYSFGSTDFFCNETRCMPLISVKNPVISAPPRARPRGTPRPPIPGRAGGSGD